jgi:hypothetical protein
MNRPGSIKIFKPSGCSSGSSRPAYLPASKCFSPRSFPPGRRAAGERGLINDAQPAADAEKFQRVFFFQPRRTSGRTLRTACSNGATPGDLRADVHLHAAQPQIFQFAARA